MQLNLHYSAEAGLKKHELVSQDRSRPFLHLVPSESRAGDPYLTSRGNHKILFFGWELEGTGEDAGNTTSVQRHRFTNLQIILQS